MPYRELTPETKLAAVREVWGRGGRVAVVARKYGVSRVSLYRWTALAEGTMREALAEGPGPRRQADLSRLEEENAALRRYLVRLAVQARAAGVQVEPPGEEWEPPPAACPRCGSRKMWRDGFYAAKEGRRQRYECSSCHLVVYQGGSTRADEW
ncbi:MAG: transposase [Thermaerobacter sp.]|nr:transposase [Thermaerobacter sp.]